jgi:hypothetical protein
MENTVLSFSQEAEKDEVMRIVTERNLTISFSFFLSYPTGSGTWLKDKILVQYEEIKEGNTTTKNLTHIGIFGTPLVQPYEFFDQVKEHVCHEDFGLEPEQAEKLGAFIFDATFKHIKDRDILSPGGMAVALLQ